MLENIKISNTHNKKSIYNLIKIWLSSSPPAMLSYTFTALRAAGQIFLLCPWRRVMNGGTKDKILLKSLTDKSQLDQELNRITDDDRRFASPPAVAKLKLCAYPSANCHQYQPIIL